MPSRSTVVSGMGYGKEGRHVWVYFANASLGKGEALAGFPAAMFAA